MEVKKYYITLSEAIREGSKLRPQSFENLFETVNSESLGLTIIKSCALGAGFEAVFRVQEDSFRTYRALTGLYPYLNDMTICPVKNCPEDPAPSTIQDVIMCLNDEHKWKRHQIADWLETEEEKLGYITLVESEPVTEHIPEFVEV